MLQGFEPSCSISALSIIQGFPTTVFTNWFCFLLEVTILWLPACKPLPMFNPFPENGGFMHGKRYSGKNYWRVLPLVLHCRHCLICSCFEK
jgi:hypothetical protein